MKELVDRYVLGELSDLETAAFEGHYFECSRCAQEVTFAAALIEGAQALASRRSHTAELTPAGQAIPGPSYETETALPARRLLAPPDRRSRNDTDEPAGVRAPGKTPLRTWLVRLAAACALPLGVTAAVHTLVVVPDLRREIARLDQPRSLLPITLRPLTRGEIPRIEADPASGQVVLQFMVTPPLEGPYRVRLLDGDVAPVAGFPATTLPVPSPGEPFLFQIPARSLRPGRYTLEVLSARPGPGSVVDHFPFALGRVNELDSAGP